MIGFRSLQAAAAVLFFGLLVPRISFADDLFADNLVGDDINDASADHRIDERTGPVRTIGRALKLVRPGDTLHIANHGTPYYESLEIVGPRFWGEFTIEGNGAVLSGARAIPFEAWKYLGDDVWRFVPRRKAFYQLLGGEKPLPEFHCPPGAAALPEIPAGHWCGWRGAIYYRAVPGGPSLRDLPLAFAADEVGITLLDADGVIIHNLEVRHFRLDGINVHDRCRNVILDSVRLIENGRAGLAVGGSSLVGLKDSTLEGNRLAQVLNAEVAQTEILSSQLGPVPAGDPILIKGGHVLVDGEE